MRWITQFWRKPAPPAASTPPADAASAAPGVVSDAIKKMEEIASSHEHGKDEFTPRTIQVLASARLAAIRLKHNFVGTEHILLALVNSGDNLCNAILKNHDLTPETVRAIMEKLVVHDSGAPVDDSIPYTPRVKKVLALAMKEAHALNHPAVDPEHILLGQLVESDGVFGRALQAQHVDLQTTRLQIMKSFGQIPPAAPRTPHL